MSFYFTFGGRGSGHVFEGGYIKIIADDEREAQTKFICKYGVRAYKEYPYILNYAFHYTEEDWRKIDVYMGKCHEVIR